ncbi:MAG: sensor histidine kinase [Sediminibacterium sp.]|jgi:two-component system NarL family sensor kinase
MPPTQTDLFYSFLAGLTVIAALFSVFALSIFYHLRKKRKQLRDKLFQDECLIEADKARIARDLHDDLGSLLTGLQFSFAELAEKDRSNPLLVSSTEQIGTSIHRLREIALNLLPRELETEGLNAAIESFVERINSVNRVQVNYLPVAGIEAIDKQKAMVLFRVIQEIVSNSIKHSNASVIDIGIVLDHSRLILEIRDNGTGFDYERCLQQKHHSGLKNIQSRIDMLNGIMIVESSGCNGTHYFITIPFRQLIHANNW